MNSVCCGLDEPRLGSGVFRLMRWAIVLCLAGCAHPAFTAKVTGEAGGRPVLLLPDLGLSPEAWQSTAEHLAAQHYQVHVLDVAGFAGHPRIDGPLLPAFRDELVRYLRSKHLQGAVLVGLMFGATAAYWVAETEPTLLAGVVAIDTPPSRFDGTVDPELVEGRDALVKASPAQFTTMLERRYSRLLTDQSLAKTLAGRAAQSDQAVYAEAFYDSMTRDLRPGLAAIQVPVLCVFTTDSVPAEAREAQLQAVNEQLKLVARQELVVIDAAHHYVMLDQPERFFAVLDHFLQRL